MGDQVHMLVSIPPKYAVSQVVVYLKGESAIHIARTYAGYRHNFIGQNFWPEVISYRQLVEMRMLSATTSKDRKRLIRELTN